MALPQGTVRWTFESYGTNAVTPAFAGNRIFVGGASIAALDPATGRMLWENETDDIADCTPLVVDGTVFVTGGDLRALDAETGAVRWRRPPAQEGGFHHAGHANGLIYVGNGVSTVRACDAKTGEDRWRTPVTGHLMAAPRLADGAVYASCSDGLHALDATTGTHRWSASAEGGLITAAAVADRRVFIGMSKSQSHGVLGVRAVDAADGHTIWHTETQGFVGSPPILDGGVLYATEASGGVLALDPLTGAVHWRVELDDAGHGLALGRGVLYVCGVRTLTALDAASRTPLWSTSPDVFGLCDPLLLEDSVVLCDDSGFVHSVTRPPSAS